MAVRRMFLIVLMVLTGLVAYENLIFTPKIEAICLSLSLYTIWLIIAIFQIKNHPRFVAFFNIIGATINLMNVHLYEGFMPAHFLHAIILMSLIIVFSLIELFISSKIYLRFKAGWQIKFGSREQGEQKDQTEEKISIRRIIFLFFSVALLMLGLVLYYYTHYDYLGCFVLSIWFFLLFFQILEFNPFILIISIILTILFIMNFRGSSIHWVMPVFAGILIWLVLFLDLFYQVAKYVANRADMRKGINPSFLNWLFDKI